MLKCTFSCRRCFNNLSSLYVLFDRTGVLKGFIIFFTATAWFVSWSFAELRSRSGGVRNVFRRCLLTIRGRTRPFRRAEGRCNYARSVSAHSCLCGSRNILPAGDLEGRAKDLGTHEFSHLAGLRAAKDAGLARWLFRSGGGEQRG